MGGNAMAPFGARRYSKEEADVVRYELFSAIEQDLPHLKFQEIPYYKKKDSFGDLDIFIKGSLNEGQYSHLHFLCGPDSPKVINGGVMSTMYDKLQIDFIPMEPEYYDTALTYYSYNDLGNLMGKLIHKLGVKYGHRGLTMPMREGDNQYDEIVLSRNHRDPFMLLGLDYDKFLKGFDTLEEIFQFVMSSKYFSPEPFQYENLNHTNRIRDRKRTTYHGFLEYIKVNPCRATYVFHEDKEKYLPHLFKFFPGLPEQYEESRAKLARRLAIKEKFNGQLVSEWTGLKDNELGQFIQFFKKKYPHSDWVLNSTIEEIRRIVWIEHTLFKQSLEEGKEHA